MFNPLSWAQGLDERVRQAAVARQPNLSRAVEDALAARRAERVADYSARQPESAANAVGGFLRNRGETTPGQGLVVETLFPGGVIPGDLKQAELAAMLQGLSPEDRQAVFEVMANEQIQRPGLGGMVRQAELGLNRAIGRDDWLGGVSRAGLYGGITAGGAAGVAGLTAAGQQLMALMENMQQENENAEKRNQELM